MDTFLRPNSIFDDGKKSSTMCSLARSFASFLPAKKAVKTILFGKAFSSRDKSRFSKCFRSMSERWKWYNRRQKVFNIIFALFERNPKTVWLSGRDCNMWNLSHNWVISGFRQPHKSSAKLILIFRLFLRGAFSRSHSPFVQVKISIKSFPKR